MTIRLACPRCGDVDLEIGDIRLELRPVAAGGTVYRFRCPECAAPVAKPATPRILFVLKAHGVVAEAPDAPPDPHAPPFTMDDLLDLHLWLASTDVPTLDLIGGPTVAGISRASATVLNGEV